MQLKALKNKVLVSDLERGDRIVRGIIIPNDNGRTEGIRARWAKVYSVGSSISDISVGQWILIEHARWTRSVTIKNEDDTNLELWQVEYPASVLAVSDEFTETEIFSKWI